MAKVLTPKAPGERVDYVWSPPLDAGDTISGAATVSLVNGTASLVSATVIANATVKLLFALGTDGETSEFLGQVTTTGGRIWEETFYLPVHSTSLSEIAAKFIQIFPQFAAVSAPILDYWIAQAQRIADTRFGDDAEHATFLLTAHYLTLQGQGTAGDAQRFGSFAGASRVKSGSLELAWSDATAIGLQRTSYGSEVWPLIRLYCGGPLVTGTGYLPYDPMRYPHGDA